MSTFQVARPGNQAHLLPNNCHSVCPMRSSRLSVSNNVSQAPRWICKAEGYKQSTSSESSGAQPSSGLQELPSQQQAQQQGLAGNRSDRQAAAAPQQLDTNVWAYKPAWCQPYTILGTGAATVAGVWAVSGGSAGWAAASAVPIAGWWYLSLIVYPAQFREYAEAMNAQQQQRQ